MENRKKKKKKKNWHKQIKQNFLGKMECRENKGKKVIFFLMTLETENAELIFH